MTSRFAFASSLGPALGPAVLLAALATAACTVNSGPGGGGGSDPGSPVKQQALAGTIDGKSFTAKVALASPGFNGSASRSITVYAVAATCDNQPQPSDGDLQILVDVDDWAAGNAYQLSLSHSATFVEEKGSSPDNFIITSGRVEVTDPGSATQQGTFSIRATSSDYGSIEGQVPVLNCAQ
jgi:hypothetical protein